MRELAGCALCAASILVASPSAAQTLGSVAVDQLRLAPPGDTFASVPSPFAAGHLVPRAMVAFDFAQRPFTLVTPSHTVSIVGSQGFLRIGASLSLWDRLLISAEAPLALVQSGDSPKTGPYSFSSPSGAAFGDLRLGLRVRLAGEDGGPVQIGAGGEIYVPTSPSGSFTGEHSVRVAPGVMAGGRAGRFVWSAAVGAQFHGSTSPATLDYGVAAGVVLGKEFVQVGLELAGSSPVQESFFDLDAQTSIPRGLTSNLELLLGGRFRVLGGLVLGVGVGPGLTSAIGTPSFRALGSIAWSPPVGKPGEAAPDPKADTDADGIPDGADACPFAFGPKATDPRRNGCPVAEE